MSPEREQICATNFSSEKLSVILIKCHIKLFNVQVGEVTAEIEQYPMLKFRSP